MNKEELNQKVNEITADINASRIKARKTSLDKQTKEQLINIILRKDDVERRNNNRIKYLKQECLNLNEKIDAQYKDILDIEKVLDEKYKLENKLINNIDVTTHRLNKYKVCTMFLSVLSLLLLCLLFIL